MVESNHIINVKTQENISGDDLASSLDRKTVIIIPDSWHLSIVFLCIWENAAIVCSYFKIPLYHVLTIGKVFLHSVP